MALKLPPTLHSHVDTRQEPVLRGKECSSRLGNENGQGVDVARLDGKL